jgi:hypothetical protein
MALDADGAGAAAASPDAAGFGVEEEEEDMAAARRRGGARWAGARKGPRGTLAAARVVAQREERERARLPPPIGFS